ncbi:hypothetical protein CASFOL_028750 [Castilleja foliolosa]|uniref:DUF8039 domain-containing protein n=1 Tax=Castilleja foliolosa TaxID=1961234 RepID=A0ABD3CCY1_9LAMI
MDMEGGSADGDQLIASDQLVASAQQGPAQPTTSQQGTSQQGIAQPTRTRKGRKSTRMAKMTMRNPNKTKVVFDKVRIMPVGPNKMSIDNWSSYLGFLGRKEPSILIDYWKNVAEPTKELIWQGILEKFSIYIFDGVKEVEYSENDEKLRARFKKKWLTYVGGRWSVFKTNLTSDYIYGVKEGPPYTKDYKFLDKVTWDAFVALRLTPEEKAKRKKAQEVQSKNKCPQRTSRGGYELLGQKIMEEKMKERQAASQDPYEIIPPPSPPTRHEKWKRARIDKSGKYTTPEVEIIAQKIDSLEEQESSGSFKASGSNDLLVVAIGKPDHPCRVRGVGRGYTVSTYFGKRRQSADVVSREEFNNSMAEMDKKLQMILSSQAFSYKEPLTPVVESAKGSNFYAALNLNDGDKADEDHINDEYELYVEDLQRRLVAYGHIHDLGSNIHNLKLKADEVRVTVVRVVVGDAEVPFLTDEVSKVAEAPQNFIVWPRRLVEHVGRKGLSQKELFPKPQSQPDKTHSDDVLKTLWFRAAEINKPKYVCMEAGVVSMNKVDMYISQEDIMGLLVSRKVSISAMQFYNRYLYSLLRLSERNGKYGLFSPLHCNSEETLQARIGQGDFECFIAPIYEGNWQFMVLCPKYSYVAWFCFLQNKPTKKIASKIETAFNTYQMMKGTHSRQLNKLKWVYPKCCKQVEGGDECGLLVMRRMFEIIKLDISDSFEKVFNMLGPYSDDEIDVVRKQWAECFLEVLDES